MGSRRDARLTDIRGTYTLSGCRPVPMTEAEIAAYEGPMEYWDGETETAWMPYDTSPQHEQPCSRVSELVSDIGKMRGKPIALLRTADLQERDIRGKRLQAAQADEVIYLERPELDDSAIVVGRSPMPDVVVEVDLTRDVRQRKLALYAKWRIPELWVEVPEAVARRRRKRPGLTIHVLKAGRYRECDESVAFPTWTADEIHDSLNEPFRSTITVRALRRVGGAMGQGTGTGPDNDPFMDAHGHAKRAEGRREATLEGLANTLAFRNIRIAGRLADEADRILALPNAAVVEAAMRCSDYDDFLDRIGAASR